MNVSKPKSTDVVPHQQNFLNFKQRQIDVLNLPVLCFPLLFTHLHCL